MAAIGKREYPCVVNRMGSVWICIFPDLPGCTAKGGTSTEAVQKGEVAQQKLLQRMTELELSIPEPGASERMTSTIKIHVSKNLHCLLNNVAKQIGRPLPDTATLLLEHALRSAAEVPVFRVPSEYSLWEVTEETANFTGHWLQSIPKQLHHRIATLAEWQGVTKNLVINLLLLSALLELQA